MRSLDSNLVLGIRDAFIAAGGYVLLAVANGTLDLGIPQEYLPVATGVAAFAYRELRKRGVFKPMGANPK